MRNRALVAIGRVDESVILDAASNTIRPIIPDVDSHNPYGTLDREHSLVPSRMAGWHTQRTQLELTRYEWYPGKTIKTIAAQVTSDGLHDVSCLPINKTERPVNLYAAALSAVGAFGAPTAGFLVLPNLLTRPGRHRRSTMLISTFRAIRGPFISFCKETRLPIKSDPFSFFFTSLPGSFWHFSSIRTESDHRVGIRIFAIQCHILVLCLTAFLELRKFGFFAQSFCSQWILPCSRPIIATR